MAGKLNVYLLCAVCFLIALCHAINGTDDDSQPVQDLFCWHGADTTGRMNQSCQTGKLHIPDQMSSTESPSSSSNDTSSGNTTANVMSPLATLCYRYETDMPLKFSPVGKTSQAIIFKQSCDLEGLCEGQPLNTKFRKTINNQTVILYCCNTTNCNKDSSPSTGPRTCYSLQTDPRSGPAGCINRCQSPSAPCMKKTLYDSEGQVITTLYYCDKENSKAFNNDEHDECQKNQATSDKNCVNTTNGEGTVTEVCCCLGNLCFKPPNITNLDFRNDSRQCNPPQVIPQHPKPHPKPHPDPDHKPTTGDKGGVDWLFIGGIIGAVVLVIIIISTVLIVVARHRQNLNKSSRLTLAYSRLAADRLPDDSDDVQMLLS